MEDQLSERFNEAFQLAYSLHCDQYRKGTKIPYISHLMSVAALVLEHGGAEDQAIAALLHDAVEDQGGLETADKIRATFGNTVADIVLACSDSVTEEKPPWRKRKEAYLSHLREAEPDVLLVSLADKVHNARAILMDYKQLGDDLWGRFNRGRDGILWYYESLAKTFKELLPGSLSDQLSLLVEELLTACAQIELPDRTDLPFFSYGLFKPGQLGFHRLADCVSNIEKGFTAKGSLYVRDGLPVLNGCSEGIAEGYLLSFRPEAGAEAYRRIAEIEPGTQFRWEVVNARSSGAKAETNILLAKSPTKGIVPLEQDEWDGRSDPLFSSALDVIKDALAQHSDFAWDLKPLFNLQMAYLLLWSAIERYASLRYHLGHEVMKKVMNLAEEPAFSRELSNQVSETRFVYRADRPSQKVTLDPEKPRKALVYYYQIRSNITHRGKAVVRDHEKIQKSLAELLPIFKKVLAEAFSSAWPENLQRD